MIHNHPEYSKLITKYFPNSEGKHLNIEIIQNPPKEYIETLFDRLKKHENYESLKNDLIYDKDTNVFMHLHDQIDLSELTDLNEEERFFIWFMSKTEIKRAFNIKSAKDYLLRMRAEQVEENPRLGRTLEKLRKKYGENWSFENHCETEQYLDYMSNMSSKNRTICESIPHGTIHSKEVNAMCIKTPFGNIITLSYALREFLFYMNIFHFGDQLEVDYDDALSSFILATRIMLGKETLDFELDPRAELPASIENVINYHTDWQMSFIIGHEYAHHYLGHLNSKATLKAHERNGKGIKDMYTYSQQCEFEADINSIIEVSHDNFDVEELLNGAFMFFISLDFYYGVEDYIFPKHRASNTHPSPMERLWNLRDKIDSSIGYTREELSRFIKRNQEFMDGFRTDFLPFHIEDIEMYGSNYLPGFRKKILFDRLDF